MRALTVYMLNSAYPVVSVEKILNKIGGYKIYAELNLKKAAFWQTPSNPTFLYALNYKIILGVLQVQLLLLPQILLYQLDWLIKALQ